MNICEYLKMTFVKVEKSTEKKINEEVMDKEKI